MTLSTEGKEIPCAPRVDGDAGKAAPRAVAPENARAACTLDEENRNVQAALDEMNRIAFAQKEPPPTEKEKVSAVTSGVVATIAAVLVPGIPWVLTWIVVFVGMTFLLMYMRDG